MIAMFLASSMGAIDFLVSFLVFVIVVAVVIIGVKWLLSLTGVVIPQPLMIMLGLLCFLVLLLFFLNFVGLYHPAFFR